MKGKNLLISLLAIAAVLLASAPSHSSAAKSKEPSAFEKLRTEEIGKWKEFQRQINKEDLNARDADSRIRDYAGKMIGYFEEFRDSAQGAPFKFEANQEIIAIAIELLNDTKKVDAAIASEKDTERVLRLKLHAASLYGEIGVPDEAGKLIEQVLAATKQEYPQLRKQAESLRVTIAPTGLQFPEFPEGTKDLDGKEIKLSDYKGKVVMVDFWASWCGPCISEMPNVVSAYKKYHSKGFEIIGVSADKSKDDMLAAMKKFGMTWRQYFDGLGWENKAFRRYGITSIPSMHLIGPDGKIVASRLRGNRLGQQLEKLLGGKKEDTSKESRKAGKKQ